jgi:hypothetical protein
MSVKFLKILSIVGLSTLKHTLGGVPLAAGYDFDYFEIVGYTALGGMLGMLAFVLLMSTFSRQFKKWFPAKKKKKIFSRKNRFIVRIKRNFGLAGIAFLTPWFLSIPVGTIISMSIYRDPKKVIIFQTVSILFWSFAGAALAQPISSLFH